EIGIALNMYGQDFRDRTPEFTRNSGAHWAWDIPTPVANIFLSSGLTKKVLFDPGTEPKYTDKENFAAPGKGSSSSLWNFDPNGGFHIVGYAFAINEKDSKTGQNIGFLDPTNQNTTLQAEPIMMAGRRIYMPLAERVLVACVTISTAAKLPGYLHPENNYSDVKGAFYLHHLSAHLAGTTPSGGHATYKDGHAQWRKFQVMTPRTISGAVFWW